MAKLSLIKLIMFNGELNKLHTDVDETFLCSFRQITF